jgi:cell division protein FtsZ
MTINLSMPATHQLKPRITVVGVGGAGGNAVNNMITSHLEGVEFVVANTDAQALAQSLSERRIQLGVNITQGLGAGSQPDVGRAAAEEAIDEILENLDGSNMVFITAGMGGGTGTGGAPVVARAAREQGVLTVGVVTKPFQFEGVHRMRLAEEGLAELQQYVDTLIIIPNQNLFRVANEKTTFADAFKMADDVLYSGVRGVTDLMVMPGLINLDFADVRSVMAEMGKAMMGTGEADGENRAVIAAEAAISNPLLDDVSMEGARGVLINITGGYDMTLFEVDEAANRIRDEVDPEANIIFGSTFDEALDGCMRVSVVSTGIEANGEARPRPVVAVAERSGMPAMTMPQAKAEEVEDITLEAEPKPESVDEAVAVAETIEAPAVEAMVEEVVVEPEPIIVDEAPVVPPVDELVRDLAAATAIAMPESEPVLETAGGGPAAGQSFIPKPPVVAGPKSTLTSTPDPFAEAAISNGPATAPGRARKGPSLFERMTGTGRSRQTEPAHQTEPARQAEPAMAVASEAAAKPAPRVEPVMRAEPTLETVTPEPVAVAPKPASVAVEEDVLDIPAFLRRQTN